MKKVVIYYSMSGNCEQTANKIAEKTGAELLRIEPETAYPSKGLRKFLWGGKSALMGEEPALKPYTFNASEYDGIVFGFPVWASSFTPPIRTFINENGEALKDKSISAFACFSGSGAEKALGKLKAFLGINAFKAELILVDPKSGPKGENDKLIEEFCNKINK